MNPSEVRWMRGSLVFVWLVTAAVSLWEMHGQGRELLRVGGVADASVSDALIASGAALDALLGAWLWFRPARLAYLSALGALLGMTLVATVLLPTLWLHPLGPLTKNAPIAAILWALARKIP
jgi:hypothetical protein